eukprot:s362_g13.t1
MIWKAAGQFPVSFEQDHITALITSHVFTPVLRCVLCESFQPDPQMLVVNVQSSSLVVDLLRTMAWILTQPALVVWNKMYSLHFYLKRGETTTPCFTAQAALPYSACCVDSLKIIPYLEEMLGGVAANKIAVTNAFDMPLFQYLSQYTRDKRATYKDSVTLLSDLELVEPAFPTCGEHPSGNIHIVLKVLTKKPKKHAPLPRKILQRPIMPHQAQCTLNFSMAASGEELGMLTVALPWSCNVEAASAQLGRTMDLCFVSIDAGQTFQHLSQLRLSQQASSRIDVLCVQQAFVNMRLFQVDASADRPQDFAALLERAFVDGTVGDYPRAGWRRHYKEFAALADMLGKTEESSTVPPKAVQLILQAYAQSCRRRFDGKTPRRHRTWSGCYHAMITHQLVTNETAARELKKTWCLTHRDLLDRLLKLIAAAPVGGTYFA